MRPQINFASHVDRTGECRDVEYRGCTKLASNLREQSWIWIRLVPGVLRHVTRVMRRRWRRRWMMPGRVRVMMGVGRRVRMRVVLHLAGPGGRRGALVVLRRHLASGARAGGVSAAPAAHAAEVTRRRAARHGTSAPCNTNANRGDVGFRETFDRAPCCATVLHHAAACASMGTPHRRKLC